MTESFDVIIDVGLVTIESIWKLFRGHIGIGKTLYMTGEVLAMIPEEKIKLVITNYDLYGLPEGVEIFKSGSVRKIMERMLRNYDTVTKKPKVPVLIAIDEINNTLSSKQAASNISTWITTIASNARKYGVKAFYFSTQGRKQSDYRLRVNCSYEIVPTGEMDIDGHPLAYWWEDIERAETDYHRGESKYEDAVLIASDFTVKELQSRYNTTELVPIDLSPSVKEEELDEVMDLFLPWCAKKGISLQEYKRTDVKDFIKRWNNDKSVNVIPYSPSGEGVIFNECILRGYVEPKTDEPEIAEEAPELEVERTALPERVAAVAIGNEKPNTDSGDGVSTIPARVLEAQIAPELRTVIEPAFAMSPFPGFNEVKKVSKVKEVSLPSITRGQVQFCCGQIQSNMYKHRGTKKHLKSLETGVKSVVQNDRPEPE